MKNKREMYPDYYVYVHRKASNGEVFYVGKGTSIRAWQGGSKRNEHWKRIVAKHGFTVELVQVGLRDWYAQELEVELICFYGRENLCNQTSGGDGCAGRIWTDESRAKLSAAKKGKPNHGIAGDKNHMKTKESRERTSNFFKGRLNAHMMGEKNHMHKPEYKAALSARCKGKKRPDISGGNHKLARKVLCVENGMTFDSGTCAAMWLRQNGKPFAVQSNISSACGGKLKTAYGFTWVHI